MTRLIYDKDSQFKGLKPAERLTRRDEYYCSSDELALMIKSGDQDNIDFMMTRGFPINFKVQDTDGMCYLAVDLAEHHGQHAVAEYFRALMKKGPPRQKLKIKHGNQTQEFIMPNSPEDWVMFQDEFARHFNLKWGAFKLCTQGDLEKKPLTWKNLREGRVYLVENA